MHYKTAQILFMKDARDPEVGDLCYCKTHKYFIWTDEHVKIDAVNTLAEYINTIVIEPVIVCKDKVMKGDKFVGSNATLMREWKADYVHTCSKIENEWVFGEEEDGVGENPDNIKKVLVEYVNLKRPVLQLIVDGKLNDKDPVEVQMCRYYHGLPLTDKDMDEEEDVKIKREIDKSDYEVNLGVNHKFGATVREQILEFSHSEMIELTKNAYTQGGMDKFWKYNDWAAKHNLIEK